jgi:thioester reductase-like protein
VEVLRLASTGRPKRVAHISTPSVLWSTGNAGHTLDECSPMGGPDGVPAGYRESKWAAERLTAAARTRGLDVRTFRLGPLGGHTRTGASNAAGMRWLMLRVCAELGLAPVLGPRDWWLSWAPVDFVSAAVIALTAAPRAEPDIYHLLERNEVPWAQVFSWMRRKGYRLAMADVRRWQQRMLAAVGDPETAGSIGFFAASIEADGHGGPVLPAKVRCELTDERLAARGMRCPELTADLFGFYLDVGVRQGILPSPVAEAAARRR